MTSVSPDNPLESRLQVVWRLRRVQASTGWVECVTEHHGSATRPFCVEAVGSPSSGAAEVRRGRIADLT